MNNRALSENSTGISAMRILSALAVILLHTASDWRALLPEGSFVSIFNSSIKGVSFFAAPVFVIISGYLLLSPSKTEGFKVFYKKRALRMFWPMLLWTLFYMALRFVSSTGLTLNGALEALYYGNPYYHMWFLYMIVGLYAVTPLLREFFRRTQIGAQFFGVCGLLLATWVFSFFYGEPEMFFGARFLPYLGLFTAGGLLSRLDLEKFEKSAGVIALIGILFFGPAIAIYSRAYNVNCAAAYHYTGVGCTVFAISVFIYGLRVLRVRAFDSRPAIHLVGQITLNAYLIHPFWILLAEKVFIKTYSPAKYVLSFAFIVTASFASAWAISILPEAFKRVRAKFCKSSAT